MRRRPEPDAFPTTPRAAPTDFGLFRQLDAYPVGSQPVPTSEDAADRLHQSGHATANRLLVLERLAKGAVTADAYVAELEEATGARVSPNSWAPRFTELVAMGLAERSSWRVRTRSGSDAYRYAISNAGRRYLEQREAARYITAKQQHPEAAP